MTDQTDPGAAPRWKIKDGAIAVVVCVFCAEGALAGADRSCMPSFDLGILYGQMLLLNVFLAPESIGVIAGVPAFICAAAPSSFDVRSRWLALTFAGCGLLAIILAVLRHPSWSTIAVGCGLLGAGALIGFCVRKIAWFRRFWLPSGLLLALAIGVCIFMTGHYGQNNCWP